MKAPCFRAADVGRPATIAPADEQMLESLQRTAVYYFLKQTNTLNGLVDETTRAGSPASIAMIGFALSAYPVAVERGWIARDDAVQRSASTRFAIRVASRATGRTAGACLPVTAPASSPGQWPAGGRLSMAMPRAAPPGGRTTAPQRLVRGGFTGVCTRDCLARTAPDVQRVGQGGEQVVLESGQQSGLQAGRFVHASGFNDSAGAATADDGISVWLSEGEFGLDQGQSA